MHFYLVQYPDRQPPEILSAAEYIQIKGHADGYSAVVMTLAPIELDELTQEDTQSLLNTWIDEENATGSAPQTYINLDSFHG